MNPNSMTCDTPEALRFFATAGGPAASEWMRKAADEIERLRGIVDGMEAAIETAGYVYRNTDSGPNLVRPQQQ